MRNAKTIRAGLRRLDLLAYYRAVNTRYFGGKLPNDIRIMWKSQKQLQNERRGVCSVYGYAGFDRGFKEQRIVLNIDAHVREPRQLLNTIVHEAIHVSMPFGDHLNRKSSYADTTNTSHGEMFGSEARRINALLGYKLISDKECSYGQAGRRWADDNVFVECYDYDYVDEFGIDSAIRCTHCCTKREMRKHKREHWDKHIAWSEKFAEAEEAWSDFKHDFIMSHPNDPIILDDAHIMRLYKERRHD